MPEVSKACPAYEADVACADDRNVHVATSSTGALRLQARWRGDGRAEPGPRAWDRSGNRRAAGATFPPSDPGCDNGATGSDGQSTVSADPDRSPTDAGRRSPAGAHAH